MQRAASLVPLPHLLDEFGVEPCVGARGTGVTAEDIRPDAFVPYAAFLSVLDNASRLTGRDDFGILLGKRQTLAALGPLGEVLRHAATLGEAISDFRRIPEPQLHGGCSLSDACGPGRHSGLRCL